MAKLKLKHPLNLGSRILEELTFRDYTTAADYLAFDVRGGVAQNIALIASLSGTDEVLVKRLSGADYKAACRVVDKLLSDDDSLGGGAEEGGDAEKKHSDS
jgi:hypothetical protein